ncbi:MAG: hypothetical protein IPJ41_07690 [Phycisphaerales bacterium]|nr:hypothetical protein [Phycisphaerales bacterium]
MRKSWTASGFGRVLGAAVCVALNATGASAQTAAGTPPPRDQVQAPVQRMIAYVPGQYADPESGAIREQGLPVTPTFIPSTGVFPTGTLPQPEREAGRPMRPYGDIYVPTGPAEIPGPPDQGGDVITSQPLMKNFEGPGPNGLTPPDPDLARGYEYEVAATNDDFAVYDTCGTQVFYSDINDYTGINEFMFDPKVIFDPWGGRWVMMYHLKNESTQKSEIVLIVTGDGNPFGVTTAGVWWYRFNVVQDAGTGDASWLDYADLGYSNTQLSAAGNMFRFAGGFRWARLFVFNKADIYAAASAHWLYWYGLTNGDGSTTFGPRAVKMQASWSESSNIDAMYVNSRSGGGNRITFWKIRDAFGANTLTKSDTAVADYTVPPDAVQPSGDSLDTIDCRLMTAVATTDTYGSNGIELFTGLTTSNGSDAACRLYKFDAVTEAAELDTLFFSTGWDYWFPSSAADYSGSNFWVFTRTQAASGGEPEIRFVDMNHGTFSNSSSQIKDGTGSYGGFRWGDYFGGQMDWGDYSANFSVAGRPSKVWLYAEYGKPSSWGTHVGATSVFSQGTISSVTPSTTWVINGPPGGPFSPSSQAYSLSSAANDVGTAFQVTGVPSWLTANRTYGQIWTSNSVTLSVNSNANGLGLGTYNANVVFDDCFNGQGAYTRAVQLNVQAPDLAVVSVDVGNGTYNPGDVISVTGQYKNNGNLPTGNFHADFYASDNTFISTLDTFLGTRNYSSIAAGGTLNFGAHNFTLPCLPAKPYYIGVIVTVTGDADTSDNTGYDATPITYALCPGDFNGDCAVDTRDVIAFLNAWSAKLKSADCDKNGVVDSRDVLCFLNLWTARC